MGGDIELLVIGVFGDCEVDDKRLGVVLELVDYVLFDDDDFVKYLFLVKGYIGLKVLWENNVCYFVDLWIVDGISWIIGVD